MSFAITPPSAFSLIPDKKGDFSRAIQGLSTLRQLANIHALHHQQVGLEKEVATRADAAAAAYFANASKEKAPLFEKERAPVEQHSKASHHYTRSKKRALQNRRRAAAAQQAKPSGNLPV